MNRTGHDDHPMYHTAMAHRQMSATEFKATCLAVLDEVNEHGGSVSITKRGKPVATLQAAGNPAWKSLENALRGKIRITGDIVNFNTAEEWDAFRTTPRLRKTKAPKRAPRTA